MVEELGRVRSQLELAQEQREKKGPNLASKIFRGKEEIISLDKQHDKPMEAIVKAKDEIIVRNREMEEKLLANIGALDELVEALQREQMSSVQRMVDRERVNGEEKTEVAPEETAIFVFGDRKPEREKVVEGTGKVFEQKTIPGEQKEAIRSYEPIKARDREDAIRMLKISEKMALDLGIISG